VYHVVYKCIHLYIHIYIYVYAFRYVFIYAHNIYIYIYTEEMKCVNATTRDEAARIQEWIVDHIKRLQRFITPASLPIEGIIFCTNMDKIERGRDITLNITIPDYKKYLLKVTNKKIQIERALHLSKLDNILENSKMTIKFLVVTLAGKGFFFRTKKGEIRKALPTKIDAVAEVKKHYSSYKEFKKFVIKVNLNKNNQDRLYEQYKNPVSEDIAIVDDVDDDDNEI
jgi:hypothetical protein